MRAATITRYRFFADTNFQRDARAGVAEPA
jgi:hypothetical protein